MNAQHKRGNHYHMLKEKSSIIRLEGTCKRAGILFPKFSGAGKNKRARNKQHQE
jgi:hypothetical protein